MVKVATWNVNSINARVGNVLEWLRTAGPDVVLFQEIKTLEANFPHFEIKTLGYHAAIVGQKGYNGVAILARQPIEDVSTYLPGADGDVQARYVEATTMGLRVASIYLPNGNPTGGEKFGYKLEWMERLTARARQLLEAEQPFVLGGDFNVAPTDDDVYDAYRFRDDALCRPETRGRFRALLNLGLTEAWRALHPGDRAYSYWDYFGRAFEHDDGWRIDHFLLSPQTADRLAACEIDKEPRGKPKASDHTPVWCEIEG